MKQQNQLLYGTIKGDLHNELTGGFLGDNFQLICFHGMYQQGDHDIRQERVAQMLEPLYTVMLRVHLPGGIISPQQWLGIDESASQHTLYGSIRITNRQALQLHGVLKRDIKPVHRLLYQLGLDSWAAAGDVSRNVLCTSDPAEPRPHYQAYEWVKKISEYLLPKTNVYAEVWLDGEKTAQPEGESTLGNNYLPRKFKTVVVIPPQNGVDLHINDLNFIAIGDNGQLTGFNVLVGGDPTMIHGDQSAYPCLAMELGYIPSNATLAAATAVAATQRDLGNCINRRNAKIKYTIDRLGIEVFKVEVELRVGLAFQLLRPYAFSSRGNHIGWVEGIDGKHHLTLFIPSGRLIDRPSKPPKSGLAAIAAVHTGDFRLAPSQNIITAGVSERGRAQIDALAQRYSLIDDTVSLQRRNAMACVSYPTYPLTMAEAERVLPGIVGRLDAILACNGIVGRDVTFRVTGCPSGCGRAALAEIGLVGCVMGRYDIYLDGSCEGMHIPRLYKENQPLEEIIRDLDALSSAWAQVGNPDKVFDDFATQAGTIRLILNSSIDFYLQD